MPGACVTPFGYNEEAAVYSELICGTLDDLLLLLTASTKGFVSSVASLPEASFLTFTDDCFCMLKLLNLYFMTFLKLSFLTIMGFSSEIWIL